MSTPTIANRGASSVCIITSQIPAVEVPNLGTAFLGAVQRFYEDPENLRRFEIWRNQRNGGKTIV